MKKFAVILAGCGRKDGSEINEAISLLLSIEQHHCEYQCFAPNRPQSEAIDHLTEKQTKEKRNILTEAARLARSKVLTIEEHSVIGGLGDAVADAIIGHGDFSFRKLGIQDVFGQSGTPNELLEVYGLSDAQILEAAKEMF